MLQGAGHGHDKGVELRDVQKVKQGGRGLLNILWLEVRVQKQLN